MRTVTLAAVVAATLASAAHAGVKMPLELIGAWCHQGDVKSHAEITSVYERCKSASGDEDLNITAVGIEPQKPGEYRCGVVRVRRPRGQSYEIELKCSEVYERQHMSIVGHKLIVNTGDCEVVQCE